MTIAKLAGARQRRALFRRVHLTPSCTIEISLYDYDGVYPIEVLWDPTVPSKRQFDKLAPKVDAAMAPFLAKAAQLCRLSEGGEA